MNNIKNDRFPKGLRSRGKGTPTWRVAILEGLALGLLMLFATWVMMRLYGDPISPTVVVGCAIVWALYRRFLSGYR
ncbi:MAG: hypothetical protein EA350_06470 [Gemmatimonadales bacterium]|nr:MAG: hypothetical protein EA350_06470 [Gemmatimonadales bacterium]